MWCGNDTTAETTELLPGKVWHLDVRTQQTLSNDGEAT